MEEVLKRISVWEIEPRNIDATSVDKRMPEKNV